MPKAIAALGILLILVSLVLDVTKLWWPVQSASVGLVSGVVAPWQEGIINARNTWQYLQSGGAIWQEQQALQHQIADLQNQLAKLAELEKENAWLTQQLNLLPKNLSFQLSAAELVKYEFAPTPGYALLVLRNNQVQAEDWVLANGYIVGRIVSVKHNLARMQFLTANDFRATVQVGRTTARLTGNRGISVQVSGIPGSEQVNENATVILDPQTFPHLRQFSLGSFQRVTQDGAAAELVGNLKLPLDLQDLQYLLIAPAYVAP